MLKLTGKEEAIAKRREKAANIWAALFIPILTAIFAFEIGYGYDLFISGEIEKYRLLILGFNGVTLSAVVVFALVTSLLWHEPEIRALHHGFIIFFYIFAIMVPIARIVALESPPTTTGAYGTSTERFTFGLYVFLQCFANQCSLIGVLVIRQRVFYEIFHNYNLNPSFLIGVPVYLFFCLAIATPFIACAYTGV
eukprot:Pgem_evm1s3225